MELLEQMGGREGAGAFLLVYQKAVLLSALQAGTITQEAYDDCLRRLGRKQNKNIE